MALNIADYRVNFKHSPTGTICTVETQEGKVITTGKASISKFDQPNKRIGIFISFSRAMNTQEINRDSKKLIWNEFRTTVNQPLETPKIN